ncbi:MAG: hypothetical protein GQ526_07970, partial [Ardenticatenales bacterium]|nr:hypothetical protein [Ardenticatenales bacterium]
MKRYWVVAKHELITQLRRKTFLFFALVFPLLMVGANIGIGYMTASEAQETGTLGIIGYVDQSGVLEPALEEPDEFRPFADEAAAKAALAAEEIGAYFSLPADYYSTGMVNAYTLESIPGGIEGQLRSFIRANLLAGRDPLEAERLRNPAEVTMTTLDGKREVNQDTAL